jgi:hypothetical protein
MQQHVGTHTPSPTCKNAVGCRPHTSQGRPVPGSHCLVGKRTVKAYRTFDAAAKCWVTAGSVAMADGGVIMALPRSAASGGRSECGGEAQGNGNGSNLLADTEANVRGQGKGRLTTRLNHSGTSG